MANAAEIEELWGLFRENRDQIAALHALLKENIEADARRRAEDDKRRAEAEMRRAAEDKRRAEAEEKRRAEAEMRRAEEEKRRAEAEEKRRAEAEEKRRAEEEKRRAEEEKRRAEEEKRRAADEARWRAEREAARQALDKQIAENNKQIGNLTGKWGRFVEEMVRPAAETIFQERGILVHEVYPRMRARRNGETMEIDMFVTNDAEGVAIEVKTTLGEGDVRKFIGKLVRLKTFFTHFEKVSVYGAVAAIDTPDHVRDFAINQGLFVLGQTGETVAIRNARDFRPRAW